LKNLRHVDRVTNTQRYEAGKREWRRGGGEAGIEAGRRGGGNGGGGGARCGCTQRHAPSRRMTAAAYRCMDLVFEGLYCCLRERPAEARAPKRVAKGKERDGSHCSSCGYSTFTTCVLGRGEDTCCCCGSGAEIVGRGVAYTKELEPPGFEEGGGRGGLPSAARVTMW
jgi:hypothetical protein